MVMQDRRLLYQENGLLTMNGYQTEANRSYIYAYQDDRMMIFYNDPYRKDEVLHELAFVIQENGCTARHSHVCGNDTYDLTFTVSPNNHIEMKYVVKGPHKDYRMVTILTPLSPWEEGKL